MLQAKALSVIFTRRVSVSDLEEHIRANLVHNVRELLFLTVSAVLQITEIFKYI